MSVNSIFDMTTYYFMETERLRFREISTQDIDSLKRMLQDKDVMYAYEHAFSDDEVSSWLDRQIDRYKKFGFGLWAVVEKETKQMIGQCGLTVQDCDGKEVIEVGYLFQKSAWHKGYATEAAAACKSYAFNRLKLDEVFSIIRDNNIASQNVAIRNGMTLKGSFVKHYHGMDMTHLIFSVKKEVL